MFGGLASGAATAGNLYSVAQGLRTGGVAGNAQAALGAGSIANRAGMFGGGPNSTAAGALGAAGGALGVYNGLRQGGVQGYGGAAIGGLRAGAGLASMSGNTGLASSLGNAAGYAAIPLSVYNFAQNWQSGKTGSNALQGAETGAAIGSVIPGVGTVVGALAGGAIGALSSMFGPGAKDPESATFGNYATAFDQGGKNAVSMATPGQAFQSLSGLFDLRSGNISSNVPMYNKFGRAGENQFMTSTANQINSAIKSGQLQQNASPEQIYRQVVQPWMNSWGKGDLSKDPHGAAIQNMVTQLIGQWQSGQLTSRTPVGVSGEKISGLPTYGSSTPTAGPATQLQASSISIGH